MAPVSHLGRVVSALVVSATVLAGVSCGESSGLLVGPIAFEVVAREGAALDGSRGRGGERRAVPEWSSPRDQGDRPGDG